MRHASGRTALAVATGGSVLYSDRRTLQRRIGPVAYRCQLCQARIRPLRPDRRMSEAEVDNLVKNGSAAALPWGSKPLG